LLVELDVGFGSRQKNSATTASEQARWLAYNMRTLGAHLPARHDIFLYLVTMCFQYIAPRQKNIAIYP
jgi:hypothetical protein